MEAARIAVQVFYAALVAAALVAMYYLYKWLRGIYDKFMAPNPELEKKITNMFTPHQEDGTVAPKDVAPAGTDPVDWLFMDHSLSEPV